MDSEFGSESRIEDFENGVKAMEGKEYEKAIGNFQVCMKKLSNQGLGLTSDLFPKCLQNISECYKEVDDVENALSFKKFEKLYYETVLLHNGVKGLTLQCVSRDEKTTSHEMSRDRGDGSSEASAPDLADEPHESEDSETAKRAAEYEELAKLCLEQECVSLALEYSGKATLLYRHEFGDDNKKTKKSFELFTNVYAEAGKKQYSESMKEADLEDGSTISSPAEVEETILRHRRNITRNVDGTQGNSTSSDKKPLKRTRSILKKTSKESLGQLNGDQSPTEPQRRVTFADPLPQLDRLRDDDEHDNSAANLLLFILVCVLIVLTSLLLSALFCQIKPEMSACVEFRREITYYYNNLRYLYRAYFSR